MKQYIGSKIVKAAPAYRCTCPGGFVTYAGEHDIVPAGSSVEDGYRVQYEDGYLSWSPKAVFEEANSMRKTKNKPISWAFGYKPVPGKGGKSTNSLIGDTRFIVRRRKPRRNKP